jgi:hypothetical protein
MDGLGAGSKNKNGLMDSPIESGLRVMRADITGD